MVYVSRALALSALMAMANAQINLIEAVGNSGKSGALQLVSSDAKDAQIMNDVEIKANIVNQCGRTLLKGNIDIGQNTEDAIAAGAVTTVTKGSKVTATFKQVQDGGPISCDLDLTSNGNGVSGQTKLKVQQQKQGQNVKVTIDMPANMKLIGGSTGDIGTIRCRNAQNFGSCFPIQQTDTTPNKNLPSNIAATDTVANLLNKVANNNREFKDVAAASAAATTEDEQGTAVVDALLKLNPDVVKSNQQALAKGKAAAGNAANGGGKNNANGAKKNNAAKKNNRAAGAKKNNRAAGAKKNNRAAAGANRAKQNNRAAAKRKNRSVDVSADVAASNIQKRELHFARRAVAELAVKWAREVFAEEAPEDDEE